MIIIDFIYIIYIIIISPYYLFKFTTSHYHRQGLIQRCGFLKARNSNLKCIWLHGASVGEINASAFLIKRIGELFPSYELVISTTTSASQELVKQKYPDMISFFFPIDLSAIIQKTLRLIRPNIVILIEQELWPNLINIASSKNIPIILLNGRITEKSAKRYRLIKHLIKKIWGKVSYFCVQNHDCQERFMQLGVTPDKIKITGNMKYDIINTDSNPNIQYKKIFGINTDNLIIVAGSTHEPEEEIIIDIYAELKNSMKNLSLVVAPRHPFRFDEISHLITKKGFHCLRRTTLNPPPDNSDSIILLDTIGELQMVYYSADIVFVGGSMSINRGGQSILEPAAAGKPIIFGPDMENFREIAESLIAEGGAISVRNRNELLPAFLSLLSAPETLSQVGQKAKSVIIRHQGATKRNMEFIEKLVDRA